MMISGNEDKAKPQLAYVCCSNSNNIPNSLEFTVVDAQMPENIPFACTYNNWRATQMKGERSRSRNVTKWWITSSSFRPLFEGTSSVLLIGCLVGSPLSLFSGWCLQFLASTTMQSTQTTKTGKQTRAAPLITHAFRLYRVHKSSTSDYVKSGNPDKRRHTRIN